MAILKQWRGIKTDVKKNENKYWQGYLYNDGRVESHFGRVGDAGQRRDLGYGETLFDAKCREKAKKGYVEQKTLDRHGAVTVTTATPQDLARVATQQIRSNSARVGRLIQRLADANVHAILETTSLSYDPATGLFATPLGIVTDAALQEARQVLAVIRDCVRRGAYHEAQLLQATNRFFALIPQNFGRRRRTMQELFPDSKSIEDRADVLDRLQVSLQIAMSGTQLHNNPQHPVFEASLNVIESRTEFHALNHKFKSSANQNHSCASLKLQRAYRIEIASMQRAFDTTGKSIDNIQELWHGTATQNILSILKDGFRIKPPTTARITGKMFGEGVYFARQSTKSLAYAYGCWNGTRNKDCFMLLCDVAVGKYQIPSGATSKRPDRGYNSYWAQPGKTSGIINDEIVVFDASQINPKFLLHFREE